MKTTKKKLLKNVNFIFCTFVLKYNKYAHTKTIYFSSEKS